LDSLAFSGSSLFERQCPANHAQGEKGPRRTEHDHGKHASEQDKALPVQKESAQERHERGAQKNAQGVVKERSDLPAELGEKVNVHPELNATPQNSARSVDRLHGIGGM
jgi:hypothetical protein